MGTTSSCDPLNPIQTIFIILEWTAKLQPPGWSKCDMMIWNPPMVRASLRTTNWPVPLDFATEVWLDLPMASSISKSNDVAIEKAVQYPRMLEKLLEDSWPQNLLRFCIFLFLLFVVYFPISQDIFLCSLIPKLKKWDKLYFQALSGALQDGISWRAALFFALHRAISTGKNIFLKVLKIPGNPAHNPFGRTNFKKRYCEEVKTTMVDFNNKILNVKLVDTNMNRRSNRMVLLLKVVPPA